MNATVKLLVATTLMLFSAVAHAQDGPPDCNSSSAIDGLKQSFDSSQYALRLALSVTDVTNIEEYGLDGNSAIRRCTGILRLNNNGRAIVDYVIVRRGSRTRLAFKSYAIVPGPLGEFE